MLAELEVMLAELKEIILMNIEYIMSLGAIGVVFVFPLVYKKLVLIKKIIHSALGHKRRDSGFKRDIQFKDLVEEMMATIRNSAIHQLEQRNLNQEEYTALLNQLKVLRDSIIYSPRGAAWEVGIFSFLDWLPEYRLKKLDSSVVTHLESAITSLAGEPDSMFFLCSKSISEAIEALNKRGLLEVRRGVA